jgi:hypothetical protein
MLSSEFFRAAVVMLGLGTATAVSPYVLVANTERELPAPQRLAPVSTSGISTIAGTLHLYGCTVEAGAIELRALPMTVARLDGRRGNPGLRVTELRTRLQPTATPHVYRFAFLGVAPGAPYQLGIRLHPQDACGTVHWRAPLDGLVFGGSPRVALEGFAETTAVEVRDAEGDWVKADALRLDQRTGGVRTFRWRSTLTRVTGGELRVSLSPFPMEPLPLPCVEPDEGVVHRERFTLPDGSREQLVSVDLGAILGRLGADRADASALRPFRAGAPLYVRVVPALPEGLGCDPEQHGIPGTAALAKIPGGSLPPVEPPPPVPPVLPGDGHSYSPPFLGGDAEGRPTYGERGFKVIRPHVLPHAKCSSVPWGNGPWVLEDPFGCHLIDVGASPGSTIQPGAWFWLGPVQQSSGSSDPFSGFISSMGNLGKAFSAGVSLGVDTLSETWEDIKNTAATVIVDVITWVPGIGDACDAIASTGTTSCDGLVKAGIETGLMAMGVPPSIPNWEQLQQEGIDYLAAEMATQIEASTGAPPTLTEAALKQLAETALDKMGATRGVGTGPAYDWLIPYIGFEPAVLKVTLRHISPVPDGLTLVQHQGYLYDGAELPIPKYFPSDSMILQVPVVLQPRLDVFAAPLCRWFGSQVTCEPGSLFGQPLKAPWCQSYDVGQGKWITFDCGADPAPAIYYRDRWRTERFKNSACTKLSASMLVTGFLGIPLWSPEHSFAMSAWVKPSAFVVWDGATLPICGG